MPTIPKDIFDRLKQNIGVSSDVTLAILQAITPKPDDGAQTRRDKTIMLFLGTIAIGTLMQAEIALYQSETSSLIVPS